MPGVGPVRQPQHIMLPRQRHGVRSSGPMALSGLLVRQALKLELAVEGPLQALVVFPLEQSAEKPDGAGQDQTGGNERGADDQDDGDAQDRERSRCGGAPKDLVLAHFLLSLKGPAEVHPVGYVAWPSGVLNDLLL